MQQIYEFIANKQAISRVFMLFLCCLLLSTPTFAQSSNARITIHKKNISVIEALKEVEKQTKLSVGYNESQLKNKPSIDLALEKATLENSLTEILKGTGYTYQLKGKYVIIVPQEQKATETASTKRITGRVLDDSGEPLIGVNVRVEGTSIGTITNIDGNFSLEAPAGSVLSISYVGYTPQTVKVTGQNTYSVQLASDTKLLSEVVVTALCIKREQKALSYNVQQVKSDELTQIKDANFVNSLNGKVAGVTINTSSSGVGGASRVVMRGTKSIEQSSNALYVIDGIPMYNFGGGGDTEFGSKGATEAIADINPEDIESISVLTGAAAAALYGSNAANGAIVITTKKGQVGKLQVGVSSGIEWLNAFKMPKFQDRYGTGSNGKTGNSNIYSWGPKLNSAAQTGYEPDDFFDTGAVYTNSVTLSTGTDKNQTFFSAAAVNSAGMVPNNRYNRYNFTFRNTTSFLNDKMKLDVSASYILQNDRNMTNQGQYSNPLVSAYLFPRGDDFSIVKNFERWDEARKISVQFWPQGEGDLRMQNPYWIAYRNLRLNNKKRYMASAGLSYQILDWLNVAGRVRIDNTHSEYEGKLYASSSNTLTDGSSQGHYTVNNGQYSQTYADVLVNINKRIQDFTIVANIGASYSGVNVTRINRSGMDLFADPNLVLQVGDRVMVVGQQDAVERVAGVLGNQLKRLDTPNIVTIFVGIFLGILLGSLPIAFPGMPTPLKLGLAGGPLVVAILIGRFGHKLHLVTYTTMSANLMLREIGIVLFLASVGIDAGANFVQTVVEGDGLLYVGCGFLITVIPLLIIGAIARLYYKVNYFTLMGLIAGSNTDPPALAYANQTTSGDAPAVGYSTVYPLSMFLRILTGQMILLTMM